MRHALLVLTSITSTTAQYGQYVCMVQDPDTGRRCGACLDRFDCDAPEVLLDCGMSAAYYQEGIDLGTQDACEAYLQAMQPKAASGLTDAALQDQQTGVPALAYALTMVVFSNTTMKEKNNSDASPDCTLIHILNGTKGRGLQDCVNDKLFEWGEDKLEQAACAYLTAGVGSLFCGSKVFKAATHVVNSFANKYIEQPICHAATSIERAAASVAGKAVSWFKGLFHWRRRNRALTDAPVDAIA